MKAKAWLALIGGASICAIAACSSVSATQACSDLSAAICNKLSMCAPTLVTAGYGDVPTCTTRTSITCNSALALKDTTDTPDLAENCSKAYATLSCDDAFQNNPPPACKSTAVGKIANGSACGTAGECASNVCQINATTGCGTCIAAVAAGGACQATTDCNAGLVCSSAVCVAPAGSGDTCTTAAPIVPCQVGLVCDGSQCQTPLVAGSACDPQKSLCDGSQGYWCTPHGTRCVAILFAGTGQPCGYDSTTGDLTACSAGGSCANVDAKTLMGTCAAPAADGASCGGTGPSCQAPATCLGVAADAGADAGPTGTCTIRDPSTCN
jgi:hypothetical protein